MDDYLVLMIIFSSDDFFWELRSYNGGLGGRKLKGTKAEAVYSYRVPVWRRTELP